MFLFYVVMLALVWYVLFCIVLLLFCCFLFCFQTMKKTLFSYNSSVFVMLVKRSFLFMYYVTYVYFLFLSLGGGCLLPV